MPAKNILKKYAPEQFYHVYSRGVDKQVVFHNDKDYEVFLGLFKRYLSPEGSQSLTRHTYPNYNDRLQLLCYALMPNHIHLLVYQHDERAMADFMRSLLTSYSMYFNKSNKRVGPVFQSRYKASLVTRDDYFEHISRYIHLNPHDWEESQYTSLRYYLGNASADWVKPNKILELFASPDQYLEFLQDYEGYKETLDELSWELADQ